MNRRILVAVALVAFVVAGIAGTTVLDVRSAPPSAASPAASSERPDAEEAPAEEPAASTPATRPSPAGPSPAGPSPVDASTRNAVSLDEDRLTRRIDELLSRWQADRAFWGAYVRDLNTGEELYAKNAEKAFLPASNQKLVTTAMALDALGSTYRYETTLRFDGTTTDSVMTGDLILDGSGDPTFGSVELRGQDPLREWSERLYEMGVRRIEGRLIGDDDRFDDNPYPEGWDVDYITRQAGRYMGTSASGLSYNDNVVAVKVSASRPGAPPNVTLRPTGTVDVDNQAVTSSRWRGSTLQVDRIFTANTVELRGSVARSYRGTVNVPVSNPTTFTLRSFVEELKEVGIETDLQVLDVDALEESLGRSPGEALFVNLSPPLSEIIAVVNKESNNFYAEQLFRTYGWGGSARGASKRTESFLRRMGIDTRRILVNDGSGLSRKDLITPQAMVDVLAFMNEHEDSEAYLNSLPRGGENNTTLEYRLHRVPVRAKTGSLQFVRALSGYAERPNGHRIAFAFFANNYTGPSYQITRAIDDVLRVLAE